MHQYTPAKTKNKAVWKYSNDIIQFTFFCLPYGCGVNGKWWMISEKFFYSIVLYTIYAKQKV